MEPSCESNWLSFDLNRLAAPRRRYGEGLLPTPDSHAHPSTASASGPTAQSTTSPCVEESDTPQVHCSREGETQPVDRRQPEQRKHSKSLSAPTQLEPNAPPARPHPAPAKPPPIVLDLCTDDNGDAPTSFKSTNPRRAVRGNAAAKAGTSKSSAQVSGSNSAPRSREDATGTVIHSSAARAHHKVGSECAIAASLHTYAFQYTPARA